MYTYVATAVLSATLAFGSAWQVQEWRIGKMEAENAAVRAQELAAISDTAKRQTQVVSKVQNQRLARNAVLRRDGNLAADDQRLLVDAANAALQAARSSLAACTALGATQNIVLAECTKQLVEVAADADDWAADAVMLQGAWPH